MIELLQYKDVKNSRFGFQWDVIGEFDTEEQANTQIKSEIEVNFAKWSDFKTRPKKIIRGIAPDNRHSKDLTHTERRKRWNQGNPVSNI